MSSLGVNFLPNLQNEFVRDRGVQMLHSIAVKCTCQVSDTYGNLLGNGLQNLRAGFCTLCGSVGWLFRDPVVITAMVVGIRGQRNVGEGGITQPGDMLVSPLPNGPYSSNLTNHARRIGAFDSLVPFYAQPLDDGQVIVRGAATTNENKDLKTYLTDDEDRLMYEPESSLWCEDENGVVYTEGDFILGPGKVIRWVGKQPYKGLKYTIKYMAFFEWIVFQPSMERQDAQGDLGPAVYVRKRHLVFLNQSPFALPSDRIPFTSTVSC